MITTINEFKIFEANDYWHFKWKRDQAPTGKFAHFDKPRLRAYQCELNGISIGVIANVSYGAMSRNTTNQWYIQYTAKQSNGNPVILTVRFDEDKINDAKKFFEETFKKIMMSDESNINLYSMKQAILALGRIKDPLLEPYVKPEKIDMPFTEIKKIMKKASNTRPSEQTDKSYPNMYNEFGEYSSNKGERFRFNNSFITNGKMSYNGSGPPTNYIDNINKFLIIYGFKMIDDNSRTVHIEKII